MVFLSEPKKEILRPFFRTPMKSKYIREIEKECPLSYERVHYYLRELEDEGILRSSERGKIKDYKINEESDFLEKIFGFFEMERKREFFKRNKNLEKSISNLRNQLLHGAGDPIKSLIIGPLDQKRNSVDVNVLLIAHKADTPFYNKVSGICKRCSTDKVNFLIYIDSISKFRDKWLTELGYKEKWKEGVILFGEENFWGEMLRRKLYLL